MTGVQAGETFFLTVEGIDCTGKTNIVSRVDDEARRRDLDLYVTSDPPKSGIWQTLKSDYLERPGAGLTDPGKAFVFLAGRVEEAVANIMPKLSDGIPVVSDRFVDSWVAYQAPRLKPFLGSLNEAIEYLERVHQDLCDRNLLRMPDITFYLDDQPERVLKRIEGDPDRESLTGYETLSTQKETVKVYKELARKHSDRFRTFEIDAVDLGPTIQAVSDAIIDVLF